jgi:hypothetical protein
MDRRTLLVGLGAAVAAPATAQTRTIIRYVGMVTNANFPTFLGLLADSVDTVVGMRVSVDPQPEPRSVELGEDGSAHLYDGEIEMNVRAGAHWAHGSIVLDGYWLVKYGGMYQGVLAFGLEQVDEAMIALNAGIRVEDRQV